SWPSGIQDLGTLFFGALALHETWRDRRVNAMAAFGAALLCKESAAPLAILLPAFAALHAGDRRAARPWLSAFSWVLLVWVWLYSLAASFGGATAAAGGGAGITGPVWLRRIGLANQCALADAFALGTTPASVHGWLTGGYFAVLGGIGIHLLFESEGAR